MANLGSNEITKTQEDKCVRSEVLKEPATQFLKECGAKLWRLLNTGFILTVTGAMVATFYLYHLDETKLKTKNDLAAKMLEIEIHYRSIRIKEYLDNVIKYDKIYDALEKNSVGSKLEVATTEREAIGIKLGASAAELLQQLAGKELNTLYATNLFNKHLNQNTASLLAQLSLVSEHDSRMQEILDKAIASALDTQNTSATIHSFDPKNDVPKLIEGTIKLLKNLRAVTGKSYLTNGENSD